MRFERGVRGFCCDRLPAVPRSTQGLCSRVPASQSLWVALSRALFGPHGLVGMHLCVCGWCIRPIVCPEPLSWLQGSPPGAQLRASQMTATCFSNKIYIYISKTSQVDVGLSGACWSSALRDELTERSSADHCLNPGADSSHFSSCTAVHCPALAWLQTGLCRWVMRALGAAVGASWDFISQ